MALNAPTGIAGFRNTLYKKLFRSVCDLLCSIFTLRSQSMMLSELRLTLATLSCCLLDLGKLHSRNPRHCYKNYTFNILTPQLGLTQSLFSCTTQSHLSNSSNTIVWSVVLGVRYQHKRGTLKWWYETHESAA